MAGAGHHVEEDGADESLSLTNSHQWDWEITTSSRGTPMASGDVVDGSLQGGEKCFCHRLREAKVSEHKDCNAVGNAVVAASGVVNGKGQGVAHLAADRAREHLIQAGVDGTVLFVAAVLKRGCHACLFRV